MTGEREKITEEDEWESEVFVLQSLEWMRDCPHKNRCPGARIFTHLLALKNKIDRLEKILLVGEGVIK